MFRLIIFTFLLILTDNLFSQFDTLTENNLKYKFPRKECRYDSSSTGVVGPTNCKYWIGRKLVTKEEYEDCLINPSPFAKCRPCYLINKVKNITTYDGEFYQDCGIGIYIERYKNGKIKTKGQHKKPIDNNYKEYGLAGKCSTKDGEWFYYKENGELDKKILFRDGIEIKQ
jgi:antitoxin component YwqK of YwqJK toxin-antitoxin module